MTTKPSHTVWKVDALVCLHCGERYAPAFPIPISLWSALLKAFMREHRDCEPRAAASGANGTPT